MKDPMVVWRIVLVLSVVFALVMCVLRMGSRREEAWERVDRA